MSKQIHIHVHGSKVTTKDSAQEYALERIERFCQDIRAGIKRQDKNFVQNNFNNIANIAKTAASQWDN